MKKGGGRACNAQRWPLAGSPLIHSADRAIDLLAGSIFRAKRAEENGFARDSQRLSAERGRRPMQSTPVDKVADHIFRKRCWKVRNATN